MCCFDKQTLLLHEIFLTTFSVIRQGYMGDYTFYLWYERSEF